LRLYIFILLSVILSSCGSGLQVRKSRIEYFNKNFAATVDNRPFQVKKKSYRAPTLLELFEIKNVSSDSVELRFTADSLLFVGYYDIGIWTEQVFMGRFKKKGYYQIFLRRKRIEIPPLIPIIYSRVDIDRLRLALTSEGDLIVDNKWRGSGNILILSGGDLGRSQYFFRTWK
jgi:hypothetical protein